MIKGKIYYKVLFSNTTNINLIEMLNNLCQ